MHRVLRFLLWYFFIFFLSQDVPLLWSEFRWLSERGLRKPEIVSQLCMVSVELFTSPRKQFVCTCNIPRPRNR